MSSRSFLNGFSRMRLSAGLLFLALLLGNVPLAGAGGGGPDGGPVGSSVEGAGVPAGGYGTGTQGDCGGARPKGASWVNWWGYWPWDWGRSYHRLEWYNPSAGRFEQKASASSGNVYGGTNTALANTSAAYQRGLWRVASTHATSFAGTLNAPAVGGEAWPYAPLGTASFYC